MASLVELESKFLECHICLETYRKPKTIPCLHSFCEQCLSDYIASCREVEDDVGRFPCPVCKQLADVPDPSLPRHTWASSFKTSFFLNELADCLKDVSNANGASRAHNATAEEASCTQCSCHHAPTICVNCQARLCRDCAHAHAASPAGLSHQVIEWEVYNSPSFHRQRLQQCQKHATRSLDLFCPQCNTAICQLCHLNLHKLCTGVTPLSQAARRKRLWLQELEERTNSYIDKLSRINAVLNSNLDRAEISKVRDTEYLKEFFIKTMHALQKKQEMLMAQLQATYFKHCKALVDDKTDREELLTALLNARDLTRSLAGVGSDWEVMKEADDDLERQVQGLIRRVEQLPHPETPLSGVTLDESSVRGLTRHLKELNLVVSLSSPIPTTPSSPMMEAPLLCPPSSSSSSSSSSPSFCPSSSTPTPLPCSTSSNVSYSRSVSVSGVGEGHSVSSANFGARRFSAIEMNWHGEGADTNAVTAHGSCLPSPNSSPNCFPLCSPLASPNGCSYPSSKAEPSKPNNSNPFSNLDPSVTPKGSSSSSATPHSSSRPRPKSLPPGSNIRPGKGTFSRLARTPRLLKRIKTRTGLDQQRPDIWDLVVMEGGEIILLDNANQCLKGMNMGPSASGSTVCRLQLHWPLRVCQSSDRELAVTGQDKKLYIIKVSNNKLEATSVSDTQHEYWGLAAVKDGGEPTRLAASCPAQASVHVLDLHGRVLTEVYLDAAQNPLFHHPGYLTVTSDGDLLVSDTGKRCIYRIGLSGSVKFKYPCDGPFGIANPRGIAVDGSGNVLVVDKEGQQVVRLTSSGRYSGGVLGTIHGLSFPEAIAVGPNGVVYVTSDTPQQSESQDILVFEVVF